jgi:catechol 2,3-dioxygenase-like lactoylglutathione lyase family enzyme
MKPNSISGANYYVQDLAKTAEFYEALGFRPGKEEPDRLTFFVTWFFVTFSSDDRAEDVENKGAGLSLHIKVDEIEDFHRGVVAKGMKPASEPQQRRSGGREFLFRDPDGYQLVFFEKK